MLMLPGLRSHAVQIYNLGGGRIGRDSYLLEIVDRSGRHRFIMIDCGAMRGLPLRPNFKPDIIIITHSHTDHMLMSPVYNRDYDCDFLMTGPTFYTAEYLLEDHIRVAEMNDEKPLFSPKEMNAFLVSDKVRLVYHNPGVINDCRGNEVNLPDWIEIFPGVWVYFWPAGHIRGAASIMIKTDIHKLMFSGDISVNDTPTVLGMKAPTGFEPDVLVLESTNGCSQLPDRQKEVERLAQTAMKYRLVLVPAFGVGRSPDVALDLRALGFPVFLDGKGRQILKEYVENEQFSWCENDLQISEKLFKGIRMVKGKFRNQVARDQRPKIVVSTGGMMTGPALAYAVENNWLGNPQAAILDPGYVAKDTPAHRLFSSIETGMPFKTDDGQDFKVEAHVEQFKLSAHVDGPQNLDLVKAVRPKKTYLGHGEDGSRHGLTNQIKQSGFEAEALQGEPGQVIDIN